MMGIFHKKSGDFGSMFGRHKKEKMTSKENEDEKSLVDVQSKPAAKTAAKPLKSCFEKSTTESRATFAE